MKEIEVVIKNKIHNIRGKQVMLDRDIAELYNIKARRLREQVNRNKSRFPEDFCFILNKNEVDFMVSQNAIPSLKHLGGSLPYVFTEQGVSMLSSVIKSEKAIEINIQIMRAFVAMRNFLLNNKDVFNRLDVVERKQIEFQIKTDKNFEEIFDALQLKEPFQGIFFEGQVFDAFLFVSDIIKKAKKRLVLFDNYVDESTLKLFSNKVKGVSVQVYTKHVSEKLLLAVKKFNEQYQGLEIFVFGKSHDRFLIVDDVLFHFGASLKDLGKKWFAFSKMKLDTKLILDRIPQ